MPPEWAPHSCCWMAYPCRESGFFDIEAARNEYALVARAIARYEPVRMIATPRDAEEARRRCCGRSGGVPDDIDIVRMPTDDSWTRDSAPTASWAPSSGATPATAVSTRATPRRPGWPAGSSR